MTTLTVTTATDSTNANDDLLSLREALGARSAKCRSCRPPEAWFLDFCRSAEGGSEPTLIILDRQLLARSQVQLEISKILGA